MNFIVTKSQGTWPALGFAVEPPSPEETLDAVFLSMAASITLVHNAYRSLVMLPCEQRQEVIRQIRRASNVQ